MSTNPSDTPSTAATVSTESPAALRCASYMGCRHCEEGSLVWDADAGASRCRNCGTID